MAKAAKVLCDRCESRITAGVSFCGHCGYPTRWASHEERTAWEVSQWKTADRSHTPGSRSQSGRASRRWLPRPFGRKVEEKPGLALVSKNEVHAESMYAAPATTVSTSPTPAPVATVAVAPAPSPAPRIERSLSRVKPVAKAQVSRPAIKIEPGPLDSDALADTPATVLAVRLLNARVAELDAKIRRLERELNQAPSVIDLP